MDDASKAKQTSAPFGTLGGPWHGVIMSLFDPGTGFRFGTGGGGSLAWMSLRRK